MENKTPWTKPQDKLPDEDCEVELKMESGEIIDDADYFVDGEKFQYMFGNLYHAKKENNFREFNICKNEFWSSKVVYYRIITPPEDKDGK